MQSDTYQDKMSGQDDRALKECLELVQRVGPEFSVGYLHPVNVLALQLILYSSEEESDDQAPEDSWHEDRASPPGIPSTS
ncbi:hypothetical protein Nepgr_021855 [Nepenthes gracilis]|uniref:Uncharacterized protein n=1 Tax=Nepenthes gracilis TaxID=150966 RepID=A0AAD3SZX2_NEPGR|nr:hypothetical protein Nepgr_021855 [Nepenthes gracilis]